MREYLSYERPIGVTIDNRNDLAYSRPVFRVDWLEPRSFECFIDVPRDCGCFKKYKITIDQCGHASEWMHRQIVCRYIFGKWIYLNPFVAGSLRVHRKACDPGVNTILIT